MIAQRSSGTPVPPIRRANQQEKTSARALVSDLCSKLSAAALHAHVPSRTRQSVTCSDHGPTGSLEVAIRSRRARPVAARRRRLCASSRLLMRTRTSGQHRLFDCRRIVTDGAHATRLLRRRDTPSQGALARCSSTTVLHVIFRVVPRSREAREPGVNMRARTPRTRGTGRSLSTGQSRAPKKRTTERRALCRQRMASVREARAPWRPPGDGARLEEQE